MKTLIIKLGALGDVLRTTTLLRVLDGRVSWVTSTKSAPLLSKNPFLDRLFLIENLEPALLEEEFDLVINLEDDHSAANLASRIKKKRMIGAYLDTDGIVYTDSSREWFDMSLSSRFGKERADRLKMDNPKTYQEMIFAMLQRPFRGEEYVLNARLTEPTVAGRVGLESRAGDVWPMKRWNGFKALADKLTTAGYSVKFFEQRARLEEYIDDIHECEYVVCGDTLAMHIGLALKKKLVAIFTCTAPQEIYDYGRMIKVVSPLWQKYFYHRTFSPEAAEAIPADTLFEAVQSLKK